MVSIFWKIIVVLLADVTLINSDVLSTNIAKNKMWTDDYTADNVAPGVLQSTSKSNLERVSRTQEFPFLNRQSMLNDKINEGISPGKKDYRSLIAALSKIAKVRLFEGSYDTSERNLKLNNGAPKESKYIKNGAIVKDSEQPTLSNTFLKAPLRDAFDDISKEKYVSGINEGNIQCRAILDIYILEIKEKVPSYMCKIGNKTFVLSSKRFHQDHRNNLFVKIDEDTLYRLTRPSVALKNSRFDIIPAVLILKPGEKNYDLHSQ